jgi:hypothetical protein
VHDRDVWPAVAEGQAVSLEDGSVRFAEHGVPEPTGDEQRNKRKQRQKYHSGRIMVKRPVRVRIFDG